MIGRRLDLGGRVVAVTGGGRGIGLAVAQAAAARGATPALLDLDGDRAAAAAGVIGGGALGLAVDVTDAGAVEAAIIEVVDRLGGVDVLVANAGIGPKATTVDAGDRDHQRQVLDVNLHGVWHTIWAGTAAVVSRRGHIVIVSSIAAFVVSPSWAAYAASKAAVEQLARSLRVELAPTGTTVGVAHFGVVDTELVRAFEADPITAALEHHSPAAMLRKVSAASAGAAIVRAAERRAPRTIHPGRWVLPYALRGIVGPLTDAVLVRDPRTRSLMADVRERDRSIGAARTSV